mmetsp:Transcript_63561/g.187638  ORF Transcript_63561/g.187638 Transcript_63561/m.187638 type:complete len:104 (-) Transcript_63561:71-382(-)
MSIEEDSPALLASSAPAQVRGPEMDVRVYDLNGITERPRGNQRGAQRSGRRLFDLEGSPDSLLAQRSTNVLLIISWRAAQLDGIGRCQPSRKRVGIPTLGRPE